ncbi:MAG: pilus assembly protein PilP [Burkholderiales bacterium]
MTSSRWLLLCAAAAMLLAGCGGGEFEDLNRFVEESKQGLRGRVDPLPEVRQFEPVVYNAFELSDPFQPRKTEAVELAGGGPAPDVNRRKEALESFPLETLKMVGTIEQRQARFALIKTPDNNLYRVRVGNYMGQNFGVVTAISEAGVTLREVVQDPTSGGWSERTSSLQLLEQ